ncbi:MAG: AAA family ATPase, partial [Acidobacteriota bacterium]
LPDLLSEPEESVAFVWDQTLSTAGFSICSAKPKVGKSTVARNLAVAVATGAAFLGRTTQAGAVLYLCLEEKRSEIASHFRRMGVNADAISVHTGKPPDNAVESLTVAIQELNPGLVIIDPLSRIFRVSDFNDYGGVTRALEPLVDLARDTGCHILALHHDGKMGREGGDALLGSTGFFGAVDCHLQLSVRDGKRVLSSTQRYGVDLDPTIITLDKETGVVFTEGSLAELKSMNTRKAVLALFEDGEKLSQTDIKDRISNRSRGEVSTALKILMDEELIERQGSGKRNDAHVYSMASKPREVSGDRTIV